MSHNNSFMTDASNQEVINNKKNTGQLTDESNYYQEANLSRKIEFDRGMPLSFSFESNKVFTIPFTFKGYITFIWKKIAETPLNLCMVVVLLFYLISFLINQKDVQKLNLFYSVVFHLFILFVEILFTSINYINIYINDLNVNNQIAHIYDIDKREFRDKRWKEIKVGQIIKINNNEVVPADIILLEAMDHKHQCYVDNSSINGNFDMFTIKKACNDTHAATMKIIKFAEYVKNIKGILKYEEPNSNMNSFNGRLKLESFPRASDINLENFVTRGATIKNVKHVYGLVVYTGMETKMMMTLKYTQGTTSHSTYGEFTYGNTAQIKKNQFNQVIIKKDNEFIRQSLKNMQYYIIMIYLVILIILLLMGYHEAFDIYYDLDLKDSFEYEKYNTEDTIFYELLISYTQIVLTFHIFMPFNWFGLIELSYWILSAFVEWDENIKRNKDEKVEIINSYSLANFGQVRHILTDKTGTLTKRKFELKLCSIHGKIYNFDFDNIKDESYIYRIKEDDINELEILQEIRSKTKYSPLIKEFIEALCLCHSVKVSNLSSNKKNVVQPNDKKEAQILDENAQNINEQKDFASPYCEEVATFKVLKKFGYKLLISKANVIQLKINDKKRNFIIIGHNKYNKDRKKMSVVIQHRTTNGSYLLCKANDMSVFDLIVKEEIDSPEIKKSKEQIRELSKFGFRYFILLKKELNEEETTNFINKYKSAENYVVKSDEHLNNLAIEYEKDLSFLGVIFFEEKIDQELKYSISRLNGAGIKVWIASGDKRENVLSIGRALDLYDPKSIKGDFSDKDKPEDLDIKMSTLLMQFLFPNDKINKMKTRTGANVDVKSMKNGSSKDLTILISGNCFTRICNDQRNFQSLATLLSYCTSLLAYQFSPNNKFVLCQMIKNYCSKNSRLLAVGDGFNDFSMLREADLSVGILSREILQVRNTCDVIVSNFSQIVDLVLVHGTWNYRKILKIGLLSFYLHFLLLFPKLLYLNDNLYGYCFYDQNNLIFILNILILNLYVLFMVTFDIPVERALITLNFNVYRDNIYNNDSMIFKFGIELLKSFIDSVVIFFLNKELAKVSFNIEGENVDISMFGSSILNTSYILVIVKTIILNLHFINYMHIIIVIITLGCLVGVVFIDEVYKEDLLFGLTHLNVLLSNLLIIAITFAYEFAANNILFLLDYDFLSKLTITFKKNIKNYLFLKNYQQLFTNISRETPKIPNKLDKITYPEVLKRIYTYNKQLDPALENMADVSNDDASNLRIRKPILKFYDVKLEMDYTEFCDIKITFSYIMYLLTMAIFLAVDILLTRFDGQKFSKVMKIIYIICGFILLIPKIKDQFSKAFSIYFSIIIIIEIIAAYLEKLNDNDTKLCLQLFVILAFPLYYCPKTDIILFLVCLYILGITPAIYMNDFGFGKVYGGFSNFLYSNLSLIYLRHMSIYGMTVLLVISSHYIQLKNRIEFLKYHKSRIELKKDNLIMANLIPEFVRAKMQGGQRGAAYGYEEVTIVFCDISNFDTLMAKLSPKDIISFLDEFYSVLDQFCQLHGLQKIETVGKTYMAAGGIRECEIDVDKILLRIHHSIRCFEFAVDILDLVQKMILNSGDKITVKIGIHKGKVIPAVVGAHKPQFSLIGDTVNTTSRMASNGEKNCITCSEFAYEEIKSKYKNFDVHNKQIKGKGLMNLYSYDINKHKKQSLENPKGPVAKDPSGNLIVKSSTKKVPVLVKQNTKNSHRKNSMIKSSEISANESFLLNKKSLIEDSLLIVENSQELLIKTGTGIQQDNFFSNLNKFDNNTNAYNYGNYSGYDDRKNLNSSSFALEKKEPKFEKIKNTYFSDSFLFYKFKNDVSRNGFTRFENLILNQSRIRSIYINVFLLFLLLFSVYINSHYSIKDKDYLPYLQVKTALILLLLIFIFLIDKLITNYPILMFIYITIIYLGLTTNDVVFNSDLDDYNLLNMTVEEIVILTAIESCGILKYIQITINIFLHIFIYIVDIITNKDKELIRKYNIFLILIAVIKLIYITTLYFDMTSIFLANQKESKTLVDTEKMLFNLMPLHVVQNMKDDIPVADVLENVTLLFADIVRYTDFGNCHEPVEVVKMLMELFKNFDNATKACHVYKVHTIGDCYVVMGFNGKVSMNERNFYEEAKNVCKMGEEMINIIRDVRKSVNYELLDMRIGIHTGTVIAGIIGSSVVRYDIFGSDVLIANKMESSGCPGRINISEDTKKLLESKDIPYNLSVNKVVHIDAANRDITCYLIDNGQQDKDAKK